MRRREQPAIPHDPTAERAVLGLAMLTVPANEEIRDALTASEFYDPFHGRVFAAVAALAEAERPSDPKFVADACGATADEAATIRVMHSEAPASNRVGFYVERVAILAALRRTLGYAFEITEAAREERVDDVQVLLRDVEHFVAMPVPAIVDAGIDVLDLAAEAAAPRDWVIRDFLERGDRLILTSAEGRGKSLMLRQWLMMAAVGVHPWTGVGGERKVRALHVDLENSRAQSAREYRRLAEISIVRDHLKPGMVAVKCRPAGCDLTTPRDARWLEALVAHHRPELVAFGPLYKAYRGSGAMSKHGEEAAEHVTSVLDRLRVRYGFALVMEAHTTHDAPDLRPRGSRLWEGWPEFGIGLRATQDPKVYDVVRWRDPRDADRVIPFRFYRTAHWPWMPGADVGGLLAPRLEDSR